VDVVRHQTVRVNRAPEARCVRSQGHKIGKAIRVIEKARGAAVSALDDMDRNVRDHEARKPRHSIVNGQCPAIVDALNGDCHQLKEMGDCHQF
jgi:hypothetical protein